MGRGPDSGVHPNRFYVDSSNYSPPYTPYSPSDKIAKSGWKLAGETRRRPKSTILLRSTCPVPKRTAPCGTSTVPCACVRMSERPRHDTTKQMKTCIVNKVPNDLGDELDNFLIVDCRVLAIHHAPYMFLF